MNTTKTICRFLLMALLATAAFTGCSKEAKNASIQERAKKFFDAGEYDKAKIEYMNLLRADPANKTAIQNLGVIWFEQGVPLRALPFLNKTRELNPEDLGNRIKIAQAAMALGERAEARKEAIEILKKSPAHEEAILLLADTTASDEDLAFTQQALAQIPEPHNATYHLAQAMVSIRKRDPKAAELSIQKALEIDPKSVQAHLGLAALYALQRNKEKAEAEFKAASDASPLRSSARLKYAEFKAQTGATAEATALLKEITAKAPDYIPAWILLGNVALIEKKYAEVVAHLENVFGRDPGNYEARLLEGQALIAKGDAKKAIEAFERLKTAYQRSPMLLYHLARAHLQNGNAPQADVLLTEAVSISPDYTDAIILLAEVNLRTGNAEPVVSAMLSLIKKQPGMVQPRLLLTDAYRALGRLDDAVGVLGELIKASPDTSQSHFLLGVVLREQNKIAEARKTFEKALELSPDNLVIQNQLLDLDLQEKNFESAVQRAQTQIQKTPKDAGAYFMEGKVYAAQKDATRAEASLLKSLEMDSNYSAAYDLLISIYVSSEKLPEAIARLESQLGKNPRDIRSLLLLGMIHDKLKDFKKAAAAYEKLLAIKPDFATALNNLAYLKTEHFNQPDQAFDLASKARTLQPADPAIADTLGWVLYKRGDYQQALTLFQEASAKIPAGEVQFHLGMAAYMMGQLDTARTAFKKAASDAKEFPGKDQIAARLKLLGEGDGDIALDELEKLLKDQPNDPVILMRLGEAYEKQGQAEKAAAAYEKTFSLNAKMVTPLLKLAQLNAGKLNNKPKALELARKVRDLAPSDPKTAALLGDIAYKSGDPAWAYGLLLDAMRKSAGDTQILHSFAWAAYSQGKIADARQAMEKVVANSQDQNEKADAALFLQLSSLVQNPAAAEKEEAAIDKTLQEQPDYIPALMAKGVILASRENGAGEATVIYKKILGLFPDFAPAQIQLAALYARDEKQNATAYDLITKARKALPDDAEAAQVMAEVSYFKKDYSYAAQLFQDTGKKRPLSARYLYYLGISLMQQKQNAPAKEAFEKAVAAGLAEPMAADAKKNIETLSK